MNRRWWTARDRLLTPKAIAYHEAGHVVVAYEFGWWVHRGGVRLGAWAHARLRHRKADYTVLGTSENMLLARICIRMAGLLAEEKFLGQQWRFEEDVVKHLRAVRAGESEGAYLYPSDLRAIALALLDDDPTISFAGARRVVTYCRNVTNALLDDPRVWAGAERLAKALYRRRYLSPRAVKQVLGNAFFIGVRRGEGARLGRVAPSDQGSGQVPGKPLQYLGPRPAPTTIVIDGEAVCCDDAGRPSFDRIRYRKHDGDVFLYAFDLIELNGDDMRRDPLQVPQSHARIYP